MAHVCDGAMCGCDSCREGDCPACPFGAVVRDVLMEIMQREHCDWAEAIHLALSGTQEPVLSAFLTRARDCLNDIEKILDRKPIITEVEAREALLAMIKDRNASLHHPRPPIIDPPGVARDGIAAKIDKLNL